MSKKYKLPEAGEVFQRLVDGRNFKVVCPEYAGLVVLEPESGPHFDSYGGRVLKRVKNYQLQTTFVKL
jgi:hypothetical protein